jgi:hypothetical protein
VNIGLNPKDREPDEKRERRDRPDALERCLVPCEGAHDKRLVGFRGGLGFLGTRSKFTLNVTTELLNGFPQAGFDLLKTGH